MSADARPSLARGVLWRPLSVPILVKTLGIGAVVAAVFGGIILLQARRSLAENLDRLLHRRTIAEARILAGRLARPLAVNDLVSVEQALRTRTGTFPDIAYIILRAPGGRVLAHTFSGPVPVDLQPPPRYARHPEARFRVLVAGDGRQVFEASCPVVEGHAGSVQVGIDDGMIQRELGSLTRSILWSLGVSMLIGFGLALLLSMILTQPILHLRGAAEAISRGEFQERARVFSGDEIGDLAIAFNRMAGGLERYREEVERRGRERETLLARLVSSQEEERRNIARELHDHFGQSLLATLVYIQSNREFASLPPAARQALQRKVHDIIDDLQRIVQGLRPPLLDDYGLEIALQSLAGKTTEHFNLEIDCNYNRGSEPARLPEHVEVALYRVAQEALTNIVRHAQATNASVVVIESGAEVMLLIEDDGRGFDPERLPRERGFGIMGMRERVQLLGGEFALESAPGAGATVRARIPLPEWSERDPPLDRR